MHSRTLIVSSSSRHSGKTAKPRYAILALSMRYKRESANHLRQLLNHLAMSASYQGTGWFLNNRRHRVAESQAIHIHDRRRRTHVARRVRWLGAAKQRCVLSGVDGCWIGSSGTNSSVVAPLVEDVGVMRFSRGQRCSSVDLVVLIAAPSCKHSFSHQSSKYPGRPRVLSSAKTKRAFGMLM